MSELQKLGKEIANNLGYDGLDILEVTAYALEDANFHEEAKEVRKLLAKYLDTINVG